MVPSQPTVLVVGSLHYDILVAADHLPRRDETVIGSRWFPKFGGKGGNQAISARRHGVATRMAGAIGADDFGLFLRDTLRRNGVDDEFVATLADQGSGMSVAIMDGAGDYAATIVSGANLHISTVALQNPALWQDVVLLVLQNEVPDAVNLAAATVARQRGIPTVLNAAPWRALSSGFRPLIDILVVNAVEAEMMGTSPITTLAEARDAARILAAQGGIIIVTAGAKGLAVCGGASAPFDVPAEAVTVVSSHGAGDAFIGALAAELARRSDLQSACRAASLAAARHVAGQAGLS